MRGVAVLLLVSGCVAPAFDDRQLALDTALGKSLGERLEREFAVFPDAMVQAEVARIGQKLVDELPSRDLAYRFTVLVGGSSYPMNEPWPFPGGAVYVPSALILRAGSEAEFAGMLAHALVHVAERHGAQENGGGIGRLYWAWNPYGQYPPKAAEQ